MKKRISSKWDQRFNKILSLLKDKLSYTPILKYPGFIKEFSINMGASQVGLAAKSTQKYKIEGEKISMPVCFAKRS